MCPYVPFPSSVLFSDSREFNVYVPSTYTNEPTPLFFGFHGYTNSMEHHERISAMSVVRGPRSCPPSRARARARTVSVRTHATSYKSVRPPHAPGRSRRRRGSSRSSPRASRRRGTPAGAAARRSPSTWTTSGKRGRVQVRDCARLKTGGGARLSARSRSRGGARDQEPWAGRV